MIKSKTQQQKHKFTGVSYWPKNDLLRLNPPDDSLLISITDPGSKPVEFGRNWTRILRMSFSSADARDRFNDPNHFSDQNSKDIVQFLEQNLEAGHIYVHCNNGEIRSRNIAYALSRFLGVPLSCRNKPVSTKNEVPPGVVNSLIFDRTAMAVELSEAFFSAE